MNQDEAPQGILDQVRHNAASYVALVGPALDGWLTPGRINNEFERLIAVRVGVHRTLADIKAARGMEQMARLDGFVGERRRNFAHLRERLQSCEEYLLLPEAAPGSNPSWLGFLITLRKNAPCDRVDLLRYLDQHKIGTRLFFSGNVTRQPYMQGRDYRVSGTLTNAGFITERSFRVGLYPGLTTEMLDYAADRIGEFLGVGF